ncbi:MAG TPA: hypothetical protein ENJ79_02270, partial [Gammaproteobacteria bacterium]|nr:hypothetical protein [Gammaproteobacteria bacterium]
MEASSKALSEPYNYTSNEWPKVRLRYSKPTYRILLFFLLYLLFGDPASAEPYQQDSVSPGMVVIEAENYDTNSAPGLDSWISQSTLGASGSGAMVAEPNDGSHYDTSYPTDSPHLTYQIKFSHTGVHYVWVRGYGPGNNDNSVHVGLDGIALSSSDRIGDFTESWSWTKATMDNVDATIEIQTAGVHTLDVWMREDGFVIDKILLTTDPDYVPVGVGPPESPRGLKVATPLITPPGGVYANSVDVEIQSGTENALIYYTFDGTDPTEASSLYTQALTIDGSAILKARAYSGGYTESGIATESYTITTPKEGTFIQGGGADALLVMEVEHYAEKVSRGGKDWLPDTTTGYSGDGALAALPDNGSLINTDYVTQSPYVQFNVEFRRSGIHYVWVRGWAADGYDDSVHVGLDGKSIATSDRISGFDTTWSWENNTMDHLPAIIEVPAPGLHTIEVYMREDGFVMDKLLLTPNADYVVVGGGPDESLRYGVSAGDTVPPVVIAPADVVMEATAPLTPVSLGGALVMDNLDIGLVAQPVPAGPFPLGTTNVVWAATDAAGNTGTAIQAVTVKDTTAPDLLPPADIVIESSESISVSLGNATASDIFQPVSVTNNAPPIFPLGTTTVIWTATDANGNTTTAQQIVTVTPPNVAPVANAGPDLQVSEGMAGVLNGSASTDATGNIVSYEWRQTGGTTVNLASANAAITSFAAPQVVSTETLSFVLTVTDDGGLSSSDEVLVTVTKLPAVNGSGTGADVGTGGSNTDRSQYIAGVFDGQYAITPSGAANYRIPIEVPMGVGGIEPKLSITYSSQGGTGILGRRWQLSGLGAISRCRGNLAEDGVQDALRLDANEDASDRYCINGKRLVRRFGGPLGDTGLYGDDSVEYRTRIDDYTKVISYGSTVGRNPLKFIAYTKDGLTLYFGYTPDSRGYTNNGAESSGIPYIWLLNRVEDRNGNYMVINYAKPPSIWGEMQEPLVESIEYTGNTNTALSPYNKITFEYEALSWRSSYKSFVYSSTERVVRSQRLSRIRTGVNEYRLDYLPTPDSPYATRDLLYKITRCETTYNQCLHPIVIEWEHDLVANYTPNTGAEAEIGPDATFERTLYSNPFQEDIVIDTLGNYGTSSMGDFNADGLPDIVTMHTYGSGSQSIFKAHVALSTGDGRFQPGANYSQPIGPAGQVNYRVTGDFNGDGYTDMAAVNSNNSGVSIYAILNDKQDGFASPIYTNPSSVAHGENTDFQKIAADFNEDGLTDIALARTSASGMVVETALSNGDGTFKDITRSQVRSVGMSSRYSFVSSDFNGDGIADIAAIGYWIIDTASNQNQMRVWVALGNGDGTFKQAKGGLFYTYEGDGFGPFTMGDYNQDGMTDIVLVTIFWQTISGQRVFYYRYHIGLGRGDGTFDVSTQVWQHARYFPSELLTGDFNGDGFSDIALYSPSDNYVVQLDGTGNGNFQPPRGQFLALSPDIPGAIPVIEKQPTTSFSNSYTFLGGDFNADGRSDMVFAHHRKRLAIYSNMQKAVLPTLVTKVTNGLGKTVRFNYQKAAKSTLGDSSFYMRGTSSAYPFKDIVPDSMLVKEVFVSDGLGGEVKIAYEYAGAKVHPYYGFMGFSSITRTDYANQVKNTTYYSQSFPTVGLVLKSQDQLMDGRTYGETAQVWSFKRYGGSDSLGRSHYRYTLKLDKTTRTESEPIPTDTTDPIAPGFGYIYRTTRVETVSQDDYGNPTLIIRRVGEGYVKNPLLSLTSYATSRPPEVYQTTIKRTYQNIDTPENYVIGLRISEDTADTYDVAGRLPTGGSAAPVRQRRSIYSYDLSTGKLIEEINEPDEPDYYLKKDYTYNSYGDVERVTTSGSPLAAHPLNARSVVTRYKGSSSPRSPRKETIDEVGLVTSTEWSIRTGKIVSEVGPHGTPGDTTVSHYDDFARILTIFRGDFTTTNYDYNWCTTGCPPLASYFVSVKTTGQPDVVTYYDIHGRELRVETAGFNGERIFRDTEYYANGRVRAKSLPFKQGDQPLWTVYQYDHLGRVVLEIQPTGTSIVTRYEGLATEVTKNIVSPRSGPGKQVRETKVNALGKVAAYKDELGNLNRYRYDVSGNLIEVTDAAGNIIKGKYDKYDRRVELDDPNLGKTTYQYDALDNVREITNASGQSTQIRYDDKNRIRLRIGAEGVTVWQYDDPAVNGLGNLTSIVGPFMPTNFDQLVLNPDISQIVLPDYKNEPVFARELQYDSSMRPAVATTWIDTIEFRQENIYDYSSRLSEVVYPSPSSAGVSAPRVKFIYDANGYLMSVSDARDPATVYWTLVSQSAGGIPTSYTLSGGSMRTSVSLDPASNRVLGITTGSTSVANIQSLEYSYDSIGNLLARYDLGPPNGGDPLKEEFFYDKLNRVTEVQLNGQPSKQYRYDRIGNITYKSDVGYYDYSGQGGPSAVANITNAEGDVLASYTYDKRGNMVAGNGFAISYSTFNKPLSITRSGKSTLFQYGGELQRYKQQSGENVTYYISARYDAGMHFEREVRAGGTVDKYYIYATGDTPVAILNIDSAGTQEINYLHYDHLNSIVSVTDDRGRILERLSYDTYGKRRNPNWTDAGTDLAGKFTHHGFTGHEHIDQMGLVHMNARIYDPGLGRFLSADPVIDFEKPTQGLNRYTYVGNNPLSRVDLSGNIGGSPRNPATFGGLDSGSFARLPTTMPTTGANIPTVGSFFEDQVTSELETFDRFVEFLQGPFGGLSRSTRNDLDVWATREANLAGLGDEERAGFNLMRDVASDLFFAAGLFTQFKGATLLGNAMVAAGEALPRIGYIDERKGLYYDLALGGVAMMVPPRLKIRAPRSFLRAVKRVTNSGAKSAAQFENLRSSLAADEILKADRIGTALTKSDAGHRAASFLT